MPQPSPRTFLEWRSQTPAGKRLDVLYALACSGSATLAHRRMLAAELVHQDRWVEANHWATLVWEESGKAMHLRDLVMIVMMLGDIPRGVDLVRQLQDNAPPGVLDSLVALGQFRAGQAPLAQELLRQAAAKDPVDTITESLASDVALQTGDHHLLAAVLDRWGEGSLTNARSVAIARRLMLLRLVETLGAHYNELVDE